MPIDLKNERLIRFSDVPALPNLPLRRKGARLHLATVHRWRKPGLAGIQLEAVRVGGCWSTTVEALARFFDRLGAAAGQPHQVAPHQRGRDSSAVDEALDAEGIG
jgi:hypothetical protein